jgi:hypothetical protein
MASYWPWSRHTGKIADDSNDSDRYVVKMMLVVMTI